MPKKSKVTSADSARLVKRLREAHAQLRSHSQRAARAADTLARVLREVEAQIGSADGAATSRTPATRTTRAAATHGASRGPRTTSTRTGPTS